jgi:MoaA/NifB/PqqE/SkfB family radical SAM enzyme
MTQDREESIMSSGLEELNRLPYPTQIILDIHSFCNAKCNICPYDVLKGKNPMGVMESHLFTKIVDDFANLARANNFKGNILFCNMGELFFDKNVIDKIKYVIDSGLEFHIQTNANLLTPKLVDQLIKSGMRGSFVISCHGISPNVYKEIMGLEISKTIENIEYLAQNYPKEKLLIQAIPFRWPRGEARRVRNYWRQREIHVRMPLPNNRASLVPSIKSIQKKSLVGCQGARPLGEMIICFNGDVILCCNDMAQQEIVGNLANNTIEEVWNGDIFLDKIKQIYCGKRSGPDFICKKCEFGKLSNSITSRMAKNISYSLKRFFLTRIW